MTQAQLNARQQQIADLVAASGEIRLAELKEAFEVTEMTLRRDLEKLEQLGLLRRTFGGAIRTGSDVALQERTGVMLEEKKRIGLRAAQLVQPGDSIFIDGGSTTLQIARFLPAQQQLTVVTNALNIAAELQAKSIPTIVIGGNLVERTSTLVGPMASAALATMTFNRAFIGSTGLTAAHGFSNSNLYETEIKQLVIGKAAEAIVVMDHTKLGKQDLFSFARLPAIHRLVTDRPITDAALRAALSEAGVAVDAGAAE